MFHHIQKRLNMKLFQDNTGCVYLVNNPKMSEKSRHIRVKYHFIRELAKKQLIKVQYIPTEFMLADILTKAVSHKVMNMLRKSILHEL